MCCPGLQHRIYGDTIRYRILDVNPVPILGFSYQQYPCNSIHATNPLLPSNSLISSSGQVSRQPCLDSLSAVVC
ncbi:hypothetical protein DPMN_039651 [Dreissena polymorpha]|uniref:Uncharacterized protein n=1 Tax=Dreissena polymorpha TaxID=45954 RepID=A0A9D4HW35_DREPO|nr:hypothetical protein DPMN_039651 [Dreissena polymorpha]